MVIVGCFFGDGEWEVGGSFISTDRSLHPRYLDGISMQALFLRNEGFRGVCHAIPSLREMIGCILGERMV